MIIIRLDFPAGGRWHATAWGSHVNEGVPEWPPCPWRICRALLAAWHWKHRDKQEILISLIDKLASRLPEYHLPEASAAHTRHYMPIIQGRKETTTKIFDTFVHVSQNQSLWIRWNVSPSPDEQILLATLLERLNYIGRAESLVTASLETKLPPDIEAKKDWTTPLETNNGSPNPSMETIRLLAPQPPSEFQNWLQQQNNKNTTTSGKNRTRKNPPLLPTSLIEALRLDTADWKNDGWSLPPGSRWIDYSRPRDCFKIAPISRPVRQLSTRKPTVARFAIVSKIPPGLTQSLSLAERFHQGLCSRLNNIHSPTITGLDKDGNPLKGNKHTYFLPEADPHGYITHMTLHAPRGFSENDSRALSRLNEVWSIEGSGFPIDVVLLATGQPDDFHLTSPYFRPSKIWTSLTPFIPVRHAKATRTGIPKIDSQTGLQIGSPEHDCQRLLKLILPNAKIRSVKKSENTGARIHHGLRAIPCLKFQRLRRTGTGTRSSNRGYSLQIEFQNETTLPYGLGYAGHFGLGLFSPVIPKSIKKP